MSAWMHDTEIVDYIITAYQQWHLTQVVGIEDPTVAGKVLLGANAESVIYRYNLAQADAPEHARAEALGYLMTAQTYTYTQVQAQVDAALVAIACDTFDYQACEHPTYADSAAKLLLTKVAQAAATYVQNPVSDDAKQAMWGGNVIEALQASTHTTAA